ncbi:MAG: DJ-1/PfpI family protein [Flavobacterium sp.]
MLKNKTLSNTIATRQVAFLCADGVNAASVNTMKTALEAAGAQIKIIAPHLGKITAEEGNEIVVDQSYLIAASVLFDAVFIPSGEGILKLMDIPEVPEFINDSFKHCKFIAAEGEGTDILSITNAKTKDKNADEGIITSEKKGDKSLPDTFIKMMGKHRFWEREKLS